MWKCPNQNTHLVRIRLFCCSRMSAYFTQTIEHRFQRQPQIAPKRKWPRGTSIGLHIQHNWLAKGGGQQVTFGKNYEGYWTSKSKLSQIGEVVNAVQKHHEPSIYQALIILIIASGIKHEPTMPCAHQGWIVRQAVRPQKWRTDGFGRDITALRNQSKRPYQCRTRAALKRL